MAANLVSVLLHGGEGGVAGHGALAVGESADGYVAGHAQPHALGGVHYADGGVVVYCEECVGTVVGSEHFRRYALGVFAVVALHADASVGVKPVLAQGVVPSVVAVLGYLHLHGGAVECYPPTAGLYQVFHCAVGSHVVVDGHSAGVHARADAVVEHERHAVVHEFLEVVVAVSVLCLRDDDAAYLVLVERPARVDLALIVLVALGDEQAVAVFERLVLYSGENRREIEMRELRNYHSDDFHGAPSSERLCHGVGAELVVLGVGHDGLALLAAYARAALQGARHRGNRHPEGAGYVFHRH